MKNAIESFYIFFVLMICGGIYETITGRKLKHYSHTGIMTKGQHEGLYPDTYQDTFFDKDMPQKHKDNETELDKFCHENPDADECRIYDD